MPSISFQEHRKHLQSILTATMRAGDPQRAVQQYLQVDGLDWTIAGRRLTPAPVGRIFLLAAGKAAAGMGAAALELLGAHISSGILVIPPGGDPPPTGPELEIINAGHPLPDSGSLHAGTALTGMLSKTRPGDLLLCLLSGGSSAMLELPLLGLGLDDLVEITQLLLRSGVPIQEINAVRKSLSRLKGGRLLSLAAPARVVSLILSDVIGDNLADVGSGPTVPQPSTRSAARDILLQSDLWETAPEAVRRALSGDEPSGRAHPEPLNVLIGSNRLVVQAAGKAAAGLGFDCEVNPHPLLGEARVVGGRLAAKWLERISGISRPWAHISGGETTVTVAGSGRGGRNQELALAAALRIEAGARLAVLSLATDGIDGPTDAAGAIVTPATAGAIRAGGIDPAGALAENDSYTALDAAGALLRTGPSGTNLNDLTIALAYPD